MHLQNQVCLTMRVVRGVLLAVGGGGPLDSQTGVQRGPASFTEAEDSTAADGSWLALQTNREPTRTAQCTIHGGSRKNS